MSIKIKVSYNTDEELAGVIKLLSSAVVNYKVAKNNKGSFKRAYIIVEPREIKRKSVIEPSEFTKCNRRFRRH